MKKALLVFIFTVSGFSALAQEAKQASPEASLEMQRIETALKSVVKVTTKSVPNARSNATLGEERTGNGVLIENDLVLTIGYLVLEADDVEVTDFSGRKSPATVAGYDHATGFGLVRLTLPSKAQPVSLGQSRAIGIKEPVLSVPFGGIDEAQPGFVVGKRTFTGSWEYQIDDALYITPAIRNWGGAGLFSKDGALIGIGSLFVRDSDGEGAPGNMFVPTDLLKPILQELKTDGRAKGSARPWLGVSTEERTRGLVVSRVSPDGPAETAGLERGDMIVAVSGTPVATQASFYEALWARGAAGVSISLSINRNGEEMRIRVKSIDRLDFLKPRTML